LLQLANIDEWSIEQIYERLGEPQKQDLSPSSDRRPETSVPEYTVNAISMKDVDPQWLSDQIMIIDFGIAFLQEQSSTVIGTPKIYWAPEFLFDEARSVSSDIWALGCTLFEIRTGGSLFQYKSRPSRDQILIAMVKTLGILPEKWWSVWEEGRIWYETETKGGGELVDIISGTLYHQITELGVHDGAYNRLQASHRNTPLPDEINYKYANKVDGSNSTGRMIAMVAELTTSEAVDVIALVNKPTLDSSDENGSNKAKGSPASSNSKSTEKSVSSEGISTGTGVASSVKRVENVIGTEALGVDGSVEDATATTRVKDFLETAGTMISDDEARGLENLLRKALRYLPEQRLAPSEIVKHHWFFDDFEERIKND
jgi:serine/threonine-protein kinase SRPK3